MIDLREVPAIYIGNKPVRQIWLGNKLIRDFTTVNENPDENEQPELRAYDLFLASVEQDSGTVEEDYHSSTYYSLPSIVTDSSDALVIAGAYKQGVVYAMNGKTGAAIPLTFTRNSNAYELDANGLFKNAAAGIPRLDRDALTGAIKGYLVEPKRTNLVLKSTAFNSTTWLKGSNVSGYQSPGVPVVVTINAGISPNGTNDAIRVKFNRGSTGRSGIYQSMSGTVLNSAHVYELFVKPLDSTTIEQLLACATFGVFVGSNGSVRKRKFETYKNGWYRLITEDIVTNTASTFRIQITSADPITTLDCLLWESAAKVGAAIDSPIHTESSAGVREADVIQTLASGGKSVFYKIGEERTVSNDTPMVSVVSNTNVAAVLDKVLSPSESSVATGVPMVNATRLIDTGFPLAMMTKNTISTFNKNIIDAEAVGFTPENIFKTGKIVTAIDANGKLTFNFAACEVQVKWAKSKGKTVHAHTPWWFGNFPQIIKDFLLTCTVAQAEYVMRQLIEEPIKHFMQPELNGAITSWDLINEPFLDGADITSTRKYKDDPFIAKCGEGLIKKVFDWAYAINPTIKYFINEYDWQYGWKKLDAHIALTRSLRASGTPIHGFGLQFHTDIRVTDNSIKTYIAKLAAEGLLIHISEIGIMTNVTSAPQPYVMTEATHETWAKKWLVLATGFMSIPLAQQWRFTTWGTHHKSYFKIVNSTKQDYPMLINDDGTRTRPYNYIFAKAKELKGMV